MATLIGDFSADAAVGFAVDAVAVQAITSAASGSAYFSFLRRERFTCGSPLCRCGTMPGRLDDERPGELVAGGDGSGGRCGRGSRGRTALELVEPALP